MAENNTSRAKKRFVPLENNPEVMTSMIQKLGLSSTLQFHDIFSIDSEELLAFVPRPALALLLVFPVSDTYERHRKEEDAPKEEYTRTGAAEPVMWFKQTIGNACGLMALIHATANGKARESVEKDSALATLLQEALDLDPRSRADLLETSPTLESAHAAAAAQGDSVAPPADEKVDLHYLCFVKAGNGHLYELDGSRKGPLDRGLLGADEDVLSETALALSVRPIMKREEEAGGDLRFSMVALGPSFE